jgi:hypothetical protein
LGLCSTKANEGTTLAIEVSDRPGCRIQDNVRLVGRERPRPVRAQLVSIASTRVAPSLVATCCDARQKQMVSLHLVETTTFANRISRTKPLNQELCSFLSDEGRRHWQQRTEPRVAELVAQVAGPESDTAGWPKGYSTDDEGREHGDDSRQHRLIPSTATSS